MKLNDILEMTMQSGDLEQLAKPGLDWINSDFPNGYEHIGDIETIEVWKKNLLYTFVENAIPMGYAQLIYQPMLLLQVIYLVPAARGKRVLEKFIWFLKKHVKGGEQILLGDVHSATMQAILLTFQKSKRFKMSWYDKHTGAKDPFDLSSYAIDQPTAKLVMLENDGDFSTWSVFNKPFPEGNVVQQSYDWLLEEVS